MKELGDQKEKIGNQINMVILELCRVIKLKISLKWQIRRQIKWLEEIYASSVDCISSSLFSLPQSLRPLSTKLLNDCSLYLLKSEIIIQCSIPSLKKVKNKSKKLYQNNNKIKDIMIKS